VNEQLPLPISSREESKFSDFLPTRSTRLVIDELHRFIRQESERVIFLSGECGSGKSHLLHATCHALMESGELPVYLSLSQPYLNTAAFDDLEYQGVVCLDDLDSIIGQENWEETLFHFYNRCQEQKTRLLVAARKPAAKLDFVLPDLQSRLCHGLTLTLKPLSDAEKIYVLQQTAHKRGIELTIDAGGYLLRHASKDMATLMNYLEELDKANLIRQRKLTIPFIKSTLEL
jgi:DnaA-homolog protein